MEGKRGSGRKQDAAMDLPPHPVAVRKPLFLVTTLCMLTHPPSQSHAPLSRVLRHSLQGDGMNTTLSSPRAGNADYGEFSAEKEAMLHEVAMAAVQKAALGAALRAAGNTKVRGVGADGWVGAGA